MRFQKCSYRGPRGILGTRGDKEQTSKRQTSEYKEFVWSKAKFVTKLAPFRRFDGTLLSYVRQVRAFARTRQEPQKSI